MQSKTNELAGILEKQILNYRALKDIILEKREAIIANDIKGLAEITVRIEELVGSNSELEFERIEIARDMAKALDLRMARPTLALIAERIGGSDCDRLLDLRSRATDAIHEVQRQNRVNSEMLKYSANLIDSVLNSLVEAGSCDATYGVTGEANKKIAAVSLLDQEL
jgi:flagellar biosynthesis/type III secretory pathway chaperone